ncbi:replicative DNA helicase [Candidatus Palauibacter sp.]|uniref:replicative DNA helicase n=1 Tax=Candidatus Palauibacter sp. TaxID=3101350 RepID=UPI003AF2AAE1
MADTALSLPGDAIEARRTPWSEEAELSVLGAMLIDGDAVAVALEHVDDAAFYREGNRRIFRAMVRLYGRGDVIDAVTLADELKTAGELDAVGGMAYVAQLVDAVPTAANISYHCRILRDKSVLRRLISSATEIIQDAYEAPAGEVDETLDRAEQRIFEIAQAEERGSFIRIKEVLRSTMDRIDELTRNPGSITGVASGFSELDRMTAGFQPADLIVLAGRPSMGKTALALNIAQHTAIDEDVPVAIFSLEMSRDSLVQRMLCAESKVDSSRVRTGRLSTDDFTRLARGAGHLNTAPIWIDDSPGISPIELRAKVRRLHAEVGLGLVVLDYLQLMSGGGRAENRQQEISAISRSLKGIAKEVGVPLLALSQLSRAPEQREGNRPRLSDLRESGAIEQDADVVLFIFREEMHRKPEEVEEKGLAGKAELIVGKQRNGPTGSVDLYFHKAFTAFESVSRRAEPH